MAGVTLPALAGLPVISWIAKLALVRSGICGCGMPSVNGFDRLDHQRQKVIQGAGTAVCHTIGTERTNVVVQMFDIRIHTGAARGMDQFDDFAQVQFDTTTLAEGQTRWSTLRPFNTT